MKAVILAAGMGNRIRDHHPLPKGFIKIHEKAIIAESLEILKQNGIKDVLIVTGYAALYYEQLASQDVMLTTIKNDYYDAYESLYSLYCARDWVDDDFLLLESDIVYEARAVQTIINDSRPDVILLSGETQSTDEVYVEAEEGYLVNMSKNTEELVKDRILGEFVGINKLSLSAYQHLITALENDAELLQSGHYEEDGLVALVASDPIFCLKIPDLSWCEIDNIDHLQRAKQLYAKIRGKQEVLV